MGRGQASGQHSGPLLPDGPGGRKSGQERRFRLPGNLSLGAPDRTKPSISWCTSPPDRRSPCLFLFKEREDLFPSQEPVYSAFSFSNPVTVRLFIICFHPPNNKRSHSLCFLIPGWGGTGDNCCDWGPGACSAEPLTMHHPPLQAIPGWHWCSRQSCCCGVRGCRRWAAPIGL